MFKSARFRLTIIYCVIFFSIFWLFSVGLFVWMERSLGESYISKVKNQQVDQVGDVTFDSKSERTVTIAGDIALRQLKEVLLILNGSMLIIIPGLAWFLTGKTLRPIEKTYNKQKQFVSDASHELRTPLTIMQGELDIALRQPRSPREYQLALASTREEVARLHDLTEALLFVTRNDQQRINLPMDTVDIIDTLSEVTSHVQPLAKAKHLALIFEPPAASLSVKGSGATLKQLFINLIDNAIKFTPKRGSVTVSAKSTDKNIMISIADTGVGMSRVAASQAFERFYRADTSRNQVGFGLGLAICKAIVDQHQGTIRLKSEIGKGTTVTVSLPKS